jgi:hypothetical protein
MKPTVTTTYEAAVSMDAYHVTKTSISKGVPIRKWEFVEYQFTGAKYTFANPSSYDGSNTITNRLGTVTGFSGSLVQIDGVNYLTTNLTTTLKEVISNATGGDNLSLTVSGNNLFLKELAINVTGHGTSLPLDLNHLDGVFTMTSKNIKAVDITSLPILDTNFIANISGYGIPFDEYGAHNLTGNYDGTGTFYVKSDLSTAYSVTMTGGGYQPTAHDISTLRLDPTATNSKFTITALPVSSIPGKPTVYSGITISPSAPSVVRGSSVTFTASLSVTNLPAPTPPPPQFYKWEVTGNSSADTKISATGVLTVGSNETNTSLTVTVSTPTNIFNPNAQIAQATVSVTIP